MAAISSNPLLKILVPSVIAVVVAATIAAMARDDAAEVSTKPEGVVYDLSDAEAKELGVTAGDTPHDTLKTLAGAMKETREEARKANERSDRLEKENQKLRLEAANVESRIDTAVRDNSANLAKEFESRLTSVTSALTEQFSRLNNGINGFASNGQDNAMTAGQQTNPNAGTGFGLPSQGGNAFPVGGANEVMSNGATNGSSMSSGVSRQNGMVWISPSDMRYTDEQGRAVSEDYAGQKKVSFAKPFETLDQTMLGQTVDTFTGQGADTSGEKSAKTPYFTLPENSTLMGSVSMTALLGRVPLQGAVTDPYPFKIQIGRENLIANGIELPDVEGAIVSGTASGDWTLSCVRGNVESITFVFADGRISHGRSITNKAVQNLGNGSSSGASGFSGSSRIGWLSNEQGVPCIAGERKTNAREFLTSQFLLAGAAAAAENFAQSQTTTITDGSSVVSAVTGNQGKYALGQAIGGGLEQTSAWLQQRYGQTFDAIYVQPGQKVAVHITETLEIDYDQDARKVKYHNAKATNTMD